MASYRVQRVAEQILEEISGMLVKGLKDPRIGFVTITGVDVTPDFSQAWVYFSTPGSHEEREQSRQGLESAAGFIRKTLGKRLRLKNIPRLQFKYDQSLDRGDRIERLLAEVRDNEGWDDPTRTRGTPQEVASAIEDGERFLVTSHTNPDGDAVASVLAFGHILDAMGKQSVLYNPDRVPFNFNFLPGVGRIQAEPGDGPYDVTLVLDSSGLDRLGPLPPEPERGMLVGVDHHLTTEPLGKLHYLDPAASSIGEMIDRIMAYLPVSLDHDIAACIYCSILTDTGSFRYSNTTPSALRVAAKMIEQGVSPWEMTKRVYESDPPERVRLLALVLQTLELGPAGRYGSIRINRAMLEESGATEDMTDSFINYPRGIKGVEVAIQFREQDDDRIKVSFRSTGSISVADIAESFGGGGHRNAAGCTLTGPFSEIRDRVYRAVESALTE